MARQPRYVLPGQVQHVIQRGNNHASVFIRDEDHNFYLQCLSEACMMHLVHIHAYVLMPNHVHLLLTPSGERGVSKVMQSVGGRYAQYANARYRRTGTVWGGRYRSTVIDAAEYLLPCMCYVELNPVRAGLVSRPREYQWSSYCCNAEGNKDFLIAAHPVYLQLGDTPSARREKYQELFKAPIDQRTLVDIRNATNKGWVLGNEEFRAHLETILKRRVRPLPRGGDRRSARAQEQRTSKASDPFANSSNEPHG
jgi:putative transposase